MNLQIRDPRAHALAYRVAKARNISMTQAVITALEAELERIASHVPLSERLAGIAADLAGQAKEGGRNLSRDEADAMWGR